MKKLLLLSTLTAVLSLTHISSAVAQTFGGYATGAQVTVPATGTTIRAATGSLPPSGGTVDASLLVGDIPSSLTGGAVSLSAGVVHSAASGLTAANSDSSMADVSLTISGNQITADFLMARSAASCPAAVTGSSEVVSLVINGQAVVVTGAPNQTVTLANGTVVINEQSSSVGGGNGTLTVTTLHVSTHDAVTGQPLADALLATVNAEIQCSGGGPSTATSTTGGGWISDAGKETFGFAANMDGGSASGHLEYNDHGSGLTLHSILIATVTTVDCTTTITGTANTNTGAQVDFRVDVTDNGDPGRNDTFTISAAGGTHARTGVLGSGNIQVHERACP